MRTSASRTEGNMIAKKSEITTSERIPKIVIETGFCIMSDSELKMKFEIEENIVSSVYRFGERDARRSKEDIRQKDYQTVRQ